MRLHGLYTRMPSLFLGGVLASLFLVSGSLMAQRTLKLPNPPAIVSGVGVLPNPDGTTYIGLTLSGIGSGFDITNGFYDAWCLDNFGHLTPFGFSVYDSYAGVNGDTNPIPPANVELFGQTAWNETNWLINHTHGNNNDIPTASVLEVQNAIWTLQDPFYNTGFNDSITNALLLEATTLGANFIPGPGQLQGVILYADGIQNVASVQDLLIGVPVPNPISLACGLTQATFGVPYNSSLVVTGGVAPYKFSITSGSLPPGLVLDPNTGAITGTPTVVVGTFNFTAQVVDSTGTASGTATVNCGITLTPPIPPSVACPPSTGTVGVFYTTTLVVTGGIPPFTFSISAGSLPAGLTLNPNTGVISGTPTMGGSFSFTIQVVDSSGLVTGTTTTNCKIVIYQPPVLICPLAATGTVGSPYSSALTVTGGTPPFTFSIISGSLPPGLTLNTTTGAITGTPTMAGTFAFTAQVVDSSGQVAGTTTANCKIVINPLGPPPDVYEVNYFRNLNVNATLGAGGVSGATSPEEFLDIVNPGTAGASPASETNGIGNLCADIYIIDPNEELEECCGCIVTPDQLIELPVQTDLLSNPNNTRILHNGVIKIVKSLPVTGTTTKCDPGNPVPTPTLTAWITHTRAYLANADPAPTGVTLGVTESEFKYAPLSPGEQNFLSTQCELIQSQSSGAGICKCPAVLGEGVQPSGADPKVLP